MWFVCGLLFAAGLGISGMTRPDKVTGFLTLNANWDASLAFVMIGAIAVHAVGTRVARGMKQPVLSKSFGWPTRTDINFRLIAGATLFGVGWGLSGYCPGPAIVSLSSLSLKPLVFVLSMVVGVVAYRQFVPAQQSASTGKSA
jgi:hypothetical protein